jgi:hypothetical protein
LQPATDPTPLLVRGRRVKLDVVGRFTPQLILLGCPRTQAVRGDRGVDLAQQVEEDVLDGPLALTGDPCPFPEREEPRLDDAEVLQPRVR